VPGRAGLLISFLAAACAAEQAAVVPPSGSARHDASLDAGVLDAGTDAPALGNSVAQDGIEPPETEADLASRADAPAPECSPETAPWDCNDGDSR
jgi:hypothetical protein